MPGKRGSQEKNFSRLEGPPSVSSPAKTLRGARSQRIRRKSKGPGGEDRVVEETGEMRNLDRETAQHEKAGLL